MSDENAKKTFKEAMDWYNSTIEVLHDKWEPKLTALKISPSPVAAEVLKMAASLDAIGNDVALDLSKSKSIRSKLKDDIDTKTAVWTGELSGANPDWGPTRVRGAVRVRLAAEALMESFHMADAKFNYMSSVADRLKRKKELLSTQKEIMGLSRGLHSPARSDS